MRILAIESSCDETSAAIVEKKGNKEITVLSNITATSIALHVPTGGIIPENAAREQIKYIIPVITEALLKSKNINSKSVLMNSETANKILKEEIDAIAVTYGPGLVGSLLIGVETAKTLSFVFDKPIIPVNHLLAHLFANFIQAKPVFPFIGLIASGAHTDLLLFEGLENYRWLGGTRDDACGEAFDKVGRLLDLPYPAGSEIERRAKDFESLKATSYKLQAKFHSPLLNSNDFDFSFSGLKSEAARFIASKSLTERLTNEICYSLQDAIFNVLVKKTVRAANLYKTRDIFLGGGVTASKTLPEYFKYSLKMQGVNATLHVPDREFTTDNAAMVGAYAALKYNPIDWHKITADPDLYFS